MKHIHALFICLMALASPTLAETDPVPYEEFLAENDISFTASEVLEGYRKPCAGRLIWLVSLCGVLSVMQASRFECLSFDPFSLF